MTSFYFIGYEGSKLPKDPAIRRRARQQAMRDVALARKKRGNYGRHNLRQEPPCLVTIEPASPSPSPPPKSLHYAVLPQSSFALLQKVPLAGLRLGIIPVSLHSGFAATNGTLLAQPQVGSRRFLSYIPSRYGRVPCLTLAVDCVLAKMSQILLGPSPEDHTALDVALGPYNKALRAVQMALNDTMTQMNAETLCATELLGIFEFLNDNEDLQRWMCHIGGTARLIEARGVENFNTDFEVSLFLENIGSTVMESILNNTACYLNEEKWLALIQRAISSDEAFASQKDMMSMLWSALTIAPRLFRDTTRIIVSDQDASPEDVEKLIDELVTVRGNLIQWHVLAEKRDTFCCPGLEWYGEGVAVRWPSFKTTRRGAAYDIQLAMLGTYAMCRIFKARLLYALNPIRFSYLEDECQKLASRVMELDCESGEDQSKDVWSLFMSQSTWIARGILETKDLWRRDAHRGSGTIDKWKFRVWCEAIGRKIS